MNKSLLLAALLATSSLATAQNTNTNTSGSASEANSGSISGSQSASDQTQGQAQSLNGNIGTSDSQSNSSAGAVSGSASESNSNGNIQGQSQGQQANNAQDQGQSQGQMQDQQSSQANSQGVTFNQTFEGSEQRKTTKVFTNPGVQLTSSSSFSSDYCGGTVSGGASAAPIGISIGGSAPKFDHSCQALRRAEKFGMAAVNAQNMGQPELSGRLMSMMIWSICTADSGGPSAYKSTAQACEQLLLLGNAASPKSAQPSPAPAPEPRVARNGRVTPEAIARATQKQSAPVEESVALANR